MQSFVFSTTGRSWTLVTVSNPCNRVPWRKVSQTHRTLIFQLNRAATARTPRTIAVTLDMDLKYRGLENPEDLHVGKTYQNLTDTDRITNKPSRQPRRITRHWPPPTTRTRTLPLRSEAPD
jgi:hypothetical protein